VIRGGPSWKPARSTIAAACTPVAPALASEPEPVACLSRRSGRSPKRVHNEADERHEGDDCICDSQYLEREWRMPDVLVQGGEYAEGHDCCPTCGACDGPGARAMRSARRRSPLGVVPSDVLIGLKPSHVRPLPEISESTLQSTTPRAKPRQRPTPGPPRAPPLGAAVDKGRPPRRPASDGVNLQRPLSDDALLLVGERAEPTALELLPTGYCGARCSPG
jgi:hypothetical protein